MIIEIDDTWIVDIDNLIDYYYYDIYFNADKYYNIEPYL